MRVSSSAPSGERCIFEPIKSIPFMRASTTSSVKGIQKVVCCNPSRSAGRDGFYLAEEEHEERDTGDDFRRDDRKSQGKDLRRVQCSFRPAPPIASAPIVPIAVESAVATIPTVSDVRNAIRRSGRWSNAAYHCSVKPSQRAPLREALKLQSMRSSSGRWSARRVIAATPVVSRRIMRRRGVAREANAEQHAGHHHDEQQDGERRSKRPVARAGELILHQICRSTPPSHHRADRR